MQKVDEMPATKSKKKAQRTRQTKQKKPRVITLPVDKCNQAVPKGTVVLRRFPSKGRSKSALCY